MDDVLGYFLLTAGNPHLGAAQTIGSVVPRFGNRADIGQRRPRLRFRQTHRPEPAALQHGCQKPRPQIGRPMRQQQVRGGDRQHGVVGYGQVGGIEQSDNRHMQNPGGLKTAMCLRKGQREEPGTGIGLQRVCGAVGNDRPSIRNPGLPRIGFRGEGQEMVFGNGLRRIQDLDDGLTVEMPEGVRQEQIVGEQDLKKQEIQVLTIRDQGHGAPHIAGDPAGPDAFIRRLFIHWYRFSKRRFRPVAASGPDSVNGSTSPRSARSSVGHERPARPGQAFCSG